MECFWLSSTWTENQRTTLRGYAHSDDGQRFAEDLDDIRAEVVSRTGRQPDVAQVEAHLSDVILAEPLDQDGCYWAMIDIREAMTAYVEAVATAYPREA